MTRLTGEPLAGASTGIRGGRDARITVTERPARPDVGARRGRAQRGLTGHDHNLERRMVGEAVLRTPSLHNAQPWLLRFRPDRLELYRDGERALPEIDPLGREATVSCGAALFGVRLALAMLGRQAVPTLSDPDAVPRLATVVSGPPHKPSSDEERLFEAMPRRRWHRRRFAPQPVPEHVVAELETAGRAEGAWVREIRSARHRATLAALTERAAGVLRRRRSYRDELATWHRSGGHRPHAGRERGGLSPVRLAPGLHRVPMAVGDFGDGDPDHDLLLAVGTGADDLSGWLTAGQALHRVLLAATLRGLVASEVTQAVEVPGVREELAGALRLPGLPQYVLRLGYPTVAAPNPPGRPLSDVVLG